MTFLRRILGLKSSGPAARIRICVECGMPVAEHKEWCSILRTQRTLERRQAAATPADE
jgi:hypothetical protein